MRTRRTRRKPFRSYNNDALLNLLKTDPQGFNKHVINLNNEGNIDEIKKIAYLGYSKDPAIQKDVVAILKEVFRDNMTAGYKHIRDAIQKAKDMEATIPTTSAFYGLSKDISTICIQYQYKFAGYYPHTEFNKLRTDFRKRIEALDYSKEDVALRSKLKAYQDYLNYEVLKYVKRL